LFVVVLLRLGCSLLLLDCCVVGWLLVGRLVERCWCVAGRLLLGCCWFVVGCWLLNVGWLYVACCERCCCCCVVYAFVVVGWTLVVGWLLIVWFGWFPPVGYVVAFGCCWTLLLRCCRLVWLIAPV